MKPLLVVLLASATLSTAAQAAFNPPFSLNGFSQAVGGLSTGQFYGTASLGIATYDPDTDEASFAGGIRAGVEFSPFFAAELGYSDLGSIDVDDASLSTSTIVLAVKPTLPVGLLDVYARFGGHFWDAEVKHELGGVIDNSGSDFLYGAGVDLNMDRFRVGVGYTRYFLEGDLEVGSYELNLTYRI